MRCDGSCEPPTGTACRLKCRLQQAGNKVEARGSCTSKHSALEGGEGGLDADHSCEAQPLDAAAAGGRLRHDRHDVAHHRFRAALRTGANSKPFRGLVSEGCGSALALALGVRDTRVLLMNCNSVLFHALQGFRAPPKMVKTVNSSVATP